MSKRVDEAAKILSALGVPAAQQNERSALTLLALANVGPKTRWADAQQPLLRIVDIMEFMRARYGKDYAPNTRETVRRQTIHQFEQARIVDRNPDNPARATNSGRTVYNLTDQALAAVRAFGNSLGFRVQVDRFRIQFGTLQAAYSSRRDRHRVPLRLPEGTRIHLSPGRHNELQVAVIEEFGPRFAPGAEVLYVGDTADKNIHLHRERLALLNVIVTEHDKMADILLYQPDKNWLFVVEAVTSHGPVSPKRYAELVRMFGGSSAELVFVTAFPSSTEFRMHAADIAWETEVWIADNPDHMIHFNGPKFLGPYKQA